jgi:streptogramin lyase
MKSLRITCRWPVVTASLSIVAAIAAAQTPASGQLLVLLRDASALAIVDPASGTVLGRVPTVKDPHEVTASPDGRLAFVASPAEGISVIDLAARKEIRRVDPGPGSEPHDVLFAGGGVYFTIEGYKSIGRYDPQANRIDWTLGIGQDGTHLLVPARDMNTLFMPNRGSNTITIAENVTKGPEASRLTVVPIPGKTPEGIDLSPDGREIWTATRGDGGVSVVDVAARKVVQTLALGLTDANRLKFTPDGRVLIIDGGTGTLVVLDAAGRKEIKRVALAKGDTGDGAILVSRDGARAYVGLRDAHRVAVVDLKTLEPVRDIPMGAGSGPGCMYWVSAS